MYNLFQHVATFFLFACCVLMLFINGCETTYPEDVPDAQLWTDSLEMRLDIQRQILEAMNLYRASSVKTAEYIESLEKALGSTPRHEAMNIFREGKDVPSILRPAYSIWKELQDHEEWRWNLRNWIDDHETEDKLGELERGINRIETNWLKQEWLRGSVVMGEEDRDVLHTLLAKLKSPSQEHTPSPITEPNPKASIQAHEWLEKKMAEPKWR